MSIILRLGNLGSGKTLCGVRDIIKKNNGLPTYTNIKTKGIPNVIKFKPEMIIKKDIIGMKKTGEPICKLSLNVDYWKKLPTGINVVIDEIHNFADSRRSMSRVNIIVSQFIATLRRVLGEKEGSSGTFTAISQLEGRVDKNIKDLAGLVIYHTCTYTIHCHSCKFTWNETSDSPERYGFCNKCLSNNLEKYNHQIYVYYFNGIMDFYQFQYRGIKSYFKLQILSNMSKYFDYYETDQWDNLFEDYY